MIYDGKFPNFQHHISFRLVFLWIMIDTVAGVWASAGVHVSILPPSLELHILWWIITLRPFNQRLFDLDREAYAELDKINAENDAWEKADDEDWSKYLYLIGDRELTPDEIKYAESLEPIAVEILERMKAEQEQQTTYIKVNQPTRMYCWDCHMWGTPHEDFTVCGNCGSKNVSAVSYWSANTSGYTMPNLDTTAEQENG